MGGPTASVVRIEAGCPVAVADGLPSTVDGTGGVTGVADVAILGDQLYALIRRWRRGERQSGQYHRRLPGHCRRHDEPDRRHEAWLAANPPETAGWTAPPEGYPNPGNPFSMVADEASGLLWVVDALNGLVFTVQLDGTVTLAADLSGGHPVPTGIAADPAGGIYVGNLTSVPFPNGAAKVVHVAADGTVTDAWTGLTTVTGVAVGDDGTLYAIEMSTGNIEEEPFLTPGSGRLVRQTGSDSLEAVVSGLMFPIALRAAPDGALYIALPALGADDGSGQIVRVDVTGDEATPGGAGAMAEAPQCAPAVDGTPAEAPRAPDEEMGTPTA